MRTARFIIGMVTMIFAPTIYQILTDLFPVAEAHKLTYGFSLYLVSVWQFAFGAFLCISAWEDKPHD